MLPSLPLPCCIVDLETTGVSAANDRITEVAVISVTAEGVSEWSSLVNPGCRISPRIQQLTGISNAMVATAPRFAELAPELLARLQGQVFIAHNASFDYRFLQESFQREGLSFAAEVICTVRLSRRLYPQHSSHRLDSLIERHGIIVEDRHRALADARVLLDFLRQQEQSQEAPVLKAAVARVLKPAC